MVENHFNRENPFTVPEGYFDDLEKRVMRRIREQENRPPARVVGIRLHRAAIAVAACLVLAFAGVMAYLAGSEQQIDIAASPSEYDEVYQMLMASERVVAIAELLELDMSGNIFDSCCSEEDEEEIIRFLERDNISIFAIVHSMDNHPGDWNLELNL
jgi:hypothetical protein